MGVNIKKIQERAKKFEEDVHHCFRRVNIVFQTEAELRNDYSKLQQLELQKKQAVKDKLKNEKIAKLVFRYYHHCHQKLRQTLFLQTQFESMDAKFAGLMQNIHMELRVKLCQN